MFPSPTSCTYTECAFLGLNESIHMPHNVDMGSCSLLTLHALSQCQKILILVKSIQGLARRLVGGTVGEHFP